MAKKRNRAKRQPATRPAKRAEARKKTRGLNLPSLIFIGVIVLMVVAVVISSMLDDDRPQCPPGQVWSAAHGHCH